MTIYAYRFHAYTSEHGSVTISLADFMLAPSEHGSVTISRDVFPLVDVRKLLEEAKQQC